jgi:type VI secretion system protein ImpF
MCAWTERHAPVFSAGYVQRCQLELPANSKPGMHMKGFTPGLFDRLLGLPARSGSAAGRMTADELKESVARDLEALLNTRLVIPEDALTAFPESGNSIVTYGLTDFSDRSLSSPADRAFICACIEKAIARHEPRLQNVRALLEVREQAVNRLAFSISALLVASATQEPVQFDAVLHPSTLQYSNTKAGRPPIDGA